VICAVNVLTDVATTYPDKKSILMYITSLFQVLPQQVSIEAIQEVEMLPRTSSKVTREEHFQLHHQMHYSQQVKWGHLYERGF
jgi:dystrophin